MARRISRAADANGYSAADWLSLSPQTRNALRKESDNAARRVSRYAGKSEDRRKNDRPENESRAFWQNYRERMGYK